MKYIKIISVILFLSASMNLSSQENYEQKYKEAEKNIEEGNLTKALDFFKEILVIQPNNAHYNFKAGFLCYNIAGKRDSAIIYLEKATKDVSITFKDQFTDSVAPAETWFYLGRIYHSNYMFDEAIECFEKYNKIGQETSKLNEAERFIEQCKVGKELITQPIDLAVMELGGGINSIYDDHSPVLTADLKTIIFTSKREGSTGGLIDKDGKYYEDIYISYFENGRWSSPVGISDKINTNDHEASVGLSADGRILYIYKDKDGGDIYVSEFSGNDWTTPKALNKNINTKYRETHASISSDKKILYFSSNRPGGYGGMDLYYCKKILGKWGKAVNMGPEINTAFDEEGPFIHPDDSTLFFSSNGHPGMGGLDLFTSVAQKDGSWSKPKNLGYPANSTNDDVFYVSSPGGNYGFYVSNQLGTSGSTDIYSMMLPDEYRKKVGVLTGKVDISEGFDELPDNQEITITVINIKTGDTLNVYETDKVGNYTITLPTGDSYLVVYETEGQLRHTQEITITDDADIQMLKRIIPLQPVILGAANETHGITFIDGTYIIDEKSKIKINNASEDINTHDELIAEIAVPFTDDLKKERTKSIMEYLLYNNIDTNNVRIVKGDNNYFELLVADTLFLRYRDKDWTITFEDSTSIPEVVSFHKMKELMYFVKRNPELFIKVPVDEYSKSKLYYDGLEYVHNYFVDNSIDTSRIIVIPKELNLSENKCKLQIATRRGDEELAVTVLNRMKYGEKKGKVPVPVMIHGIPQINVEQAGYIKEYLAQRKIDSSLVVLKTFKATDGDYNLLRSKLTNERDKNALKTHNLYAEIEQRGYVEILPDLLEKIGVELYTASVMETSKSEDIVSKPVYAEQEFNVLSLNLRVDKTDGLKLKKISFKIGDIELTEQDCRYLFENVHQTIFMLHFEFDKHVTSKVGGLDSVSACLIKHPGVRVEISGHTDSKGTDQYNDVLSDKRAKFVEAYMLQRGVRENQLKTRGYSEYEPVAPNSVNGEDFQPGRALNRRTELKVDYIDPELEKNK